MQTATYVFEGFELSPGRRALRRDGNDLALTARAFDLLVALVERAGRVVAKSELLDAVWPNLVVEENNLHVQLSALRKMLGGKVIATVPGRGYCFAAALEARGAAQAPAAPARVEPPAPTSQPAPSAALVGRDEDLARLEGLLKTSACVTVVGPSGVGKSSLARAQAAGWTGRSAVVDLSTLTDGNQVHGALARALGVQLSDGDAAPQLLRALKGEAMLLVLDQAEHLLESCVELVTLLQTLPDVKLLITSQVPLAVQGERVQRLEPLALPDTGALAIDDLGDGALALLVKRIGAADHRFTVTAATLPVLRAICVQLDGLPLALEMAAARVPTIGLQRVHDALKERFALLTRGHRNAVTHHQTLHDALDWSYRLLSPTEQRLFRALGVFAGGFSLEFAIELLTGKAHADSAAEWEIIDGLATLADRSLVVVSADDPPRYRLLETMRAYAVEQLARAGEEDAVRGRHAAAILALFTGPGGQSEAVEARREAEMENAREAVAWYRAHDLGAAALLTARVASVSSFMVWWSEVGSWILAMEPLMKEPAGQALPAAVQAEWWTGLARALIFRGQSRANVAARRALELWRPLQQPVEMLQAASAWARSAGRAGTELDEASAALEAAAAAIPNMTIRMRLMVQGARVRIASERGDREAVLEGRLVEQALARESGQPRAADAAESNVVFALNELQRYAEAAGRGRALLARIDAGHGRDDANLPWVLWGLLHALVCLGRLEEAQVLVARAWAVAQRFSAPVMLPTLPLLAAKQGRFEVAAKLLGHARQTFESRGMDFDDSSEAMLNEAQSLAVSALGQAPVDAMVGEGRALGDDVAAALACANTA